MNNKGFTMVELLIATTLLAIVSIGLAEFSMNMLDVSDKHSRQIESASGSRFSSERITETIKRAAYIFPANTEVTVYIDDLLDFDTLSHHNSYILNTNDSIAILIPNIEGSDTEDSKYYYIFVYFIGENPKTGKYDLFEFTTYYSQEWEENTNPSTLFNGFSGNLTVLATDVDKDNCNLEYILNYGNGVIDGDLYGQMGGVTASTSNALIKGINWTIKLNNEAKQKFYVKGLSKNVPRS